MSLGGNPDRAAAFAEQRRREADPASRERTFNVYDLLRSMVLSSSLTDGQLSDYHLVVETGASRSSIRRALRQLGEEGLVSRRPRTGTRAMDFLEVPIDSFPTLPPYDPTNPERMGFRARGTAIAKASQAWSAITETEPGGLVLVQNTVLWWRDEPIALIDGHYPATERTDPAAFADNYVNETLFAGGKKSARTSSRIGVVTADPAAAELLGVEDGTAMIWTQDVIRDEAGAVIGVTYCRFRSDRIVFVSNVDGMKPFEDPDTISYPGP